ncbi:MAG: ABC transporter substrate-binding protein [Spirochaetaceae bacterium]|jgi:iron complex transport system substrate-binding protein|nr:ABC transporter substrate-binding protein [Spirochaetaceae bacterium]
MKKNRSYPPVLVVLALIAAGCGQGTTRETLTDRAGTQVTLPRKTDGIISTAPSNTEIIIDLGLADKLVAVDQYSAELPGLPGDPVLIDFSFPDAEVIIGLNPDIIIAAGHNQTISGDDPLKLVKETGISVVYIPTSDSINGIYEDIRFIAEVLQVEERGAELIRQMKEQIDAIAAIGASVSPKKSVYIEISPFPFIVSCGEGTYINQMIEIIGAKNIFAAEKGWFSPAAEAIIGRNPDVILTLVNNADAPMEEIRTRPGFETINAVKNNDIHSIDGDSASRPSPHIMLALRQMALAVYPDIYEETN